MYSVGGVLVSLIYEPLDATFTTSFSSTFDVSTLSVSWAFAISTSFSSFLSSVSSFSNSSNSSIPSLSKENVSSLVHTRFVYHHQVIEPLFLEHSDEQIRYLCMSDC